MGDLQLSVERVNGDGVTSNRRASPPDPLSISEELWGIAEETTSREVLACIHPTRDSEEKRKDVTEYVQKIIKCSIGVEVFPYGSVPLKTYLPDGDIDLTVLSTPKIEDSLPQDVLAVLQAEKLNEHAEYEVRDLQFIDAEVKLVKCLVHNIVIDISFNQLGGLSTLGFLEQIDRLVGKDHLFKRSIILIKAWCYYESRILGAHHGLISTYALESLVLYIFHLFNPSLNGPLAVLYRFLDYFSKFDWENYCVSLNGPVRKSCLPDIVAENPNNGGADLMLSAEFLRNSMEMFSVSSSRSLETNLRTFPKKHLNIIDPLKENNNLGRSVHKGNFYRIRSAFKYGARKLGRILVLPTENISDEIKKFFESTLERHGHKGAEQIYNGGELGSLSSSFSDGEMHHFNLFNGDVGDDMTLGVTSKTSSGFRNEVETSYCPEGVVLPGDGIVTDVNAPATLKSLPLRHTDEPSECSPTRRDSFSTVCNGAYLCTTNNHDGMNFSDSLILSPDDNVSEDTLSLDFREDRTSYDSVAGDIEKLNLSDLSGDYDSHLRSLYFGQCRHRYTSSPSPVLCSPPSSPSQLKKNKPWDIVHQSMPLKRKSNTNAAVSLGQPLYPAKSRTPSNPATSPTPSNAAFGLDERQKARGTGTYIPNLDCNSFRERPLQGRRRRNQAQETCCSQLQRPAYNNVSNPTFPATNSFERNGQVMVFGATGSSHPSMHVMSSGNSHGNGVPISTRTLKFGSFGSLGESSVLRALGNSTACETATSSLVELKVQNPKQVKGNKKDRVAEKSLNLKNQDDFPPLSS